MRIATSVFIMFAVAGSALATEQPAPRRVVWEACKADINALCPGVQPGGGRIKECLKANRDKISESCRLAIAAARQARREASASAPQAPAQPTPPAPTAP
jgi:hypothetical protein